MKKIATAAIASIMLFVLTAGFVGAQAPDTRTPEEKEYVFRDSLFRAIEWKMGQLVGAKMKNDPAAFRKHATDMANLATMITEGFQIKGNLYQGTKALPEIWEDFDTFEEKAANFEKNARALAASGDAAGFDPRKFGGANCGGCHRDFKRRDD